MCVFNLHICFILPLLVCGLVVWWLAHLAHTEKAWGFQPWMGGWRQYGTVSFNGVIPVHRTENRYES